MSKFQIKGKLLQKYDNSDPHLKFTKYMKFHDIKHSIYNGADNGEAHGEFHPLNDTVKDFEAPFLIVTDQFSKVSNNIKKVTNDKMKI
jgi:hypothetical protein